MSDWILLSMNVNFCLVFLFSEFSNLQDVNVFLEYLLVNIINLFPNFFHFLIDNSRLRTYHKT